MSTTITHTAMVELIVKPGSDILAQITPEQAHIWHMITGLSGEVGELTDAFKKHIIYQKPLDMENVIEEMGDIEFYLVGLRLALDKTRKEICDANIEKLSKRYPGFKYNDQAAQDRADKE